MYWFIDFWRHYFDFSGRTSRRNFWLAVATNIILFFLCVIADSRLQHMRLVQFPALTAGYFLITLIPNIALNVRRLHDAGYSGWWMFLNALPFGTIAICILQLQDGEPGINKYGPDPLGRMDLVRVRA